MNPISIPDPRLKPAEPHEIVEALRLLCSSLHSPDGSDMESLMAGYGVALAGYPRWAIANAARRFIRGEVAGQHLAFCPRPPELSAAVRAEMGPVWREIGRERDRVRSAAERAKLDREILHDPRDRQRAAAVYRDFCLAHGRSASAGKAGAAAGLDPALVAGVDDAPETWERLRWLRERGGQP